VDTVEKCSERREEIEAKRLEDDQFRSIGTKDSQVKASNKAGRRRVNRAHGQVDDAESLMAVLSSQRRTQMKSRLPSLNPQHRMEADVPAQGGPSNDVSTHATVIAISPLAGREHAGSVVNQQKNVAGKGRKRQRGASFVID
jgi:hypothetical protein